MFVALIDDHTKKEILTQYVDELPRYNDHIRVAGGRYIVRTVEWIYGAKSFDVNIYVAEVLP